MDNLIIFGALGIFGLFLVAVILLFGLYTIAGVMYAAFVSGSFDVLLIITGAILFAIALYIATGFWLQKTDRI